MENKNKKRIYRNWRIGDKCWFGKAEGVVVEVNIPHTCHPISVKFSADAKTTFSNNGSCMNVINDRSLSYVEGEIGTMPFDYEQELKVDDLVYVKSGKEWFMRYFSHYDEHREGINAFAYQGKSEGNIGTTYYSEYSRTNPLI